jgi:hypothetical protein
MMVHTVIVKAAVLLAATLYPDDLGPKKGLFRLPFLSGTKNVLAALPATPAQQTDQIPATTNKQVAISISRGGDEKVSFLQKHPFYSACGITTVNAFCADLLTQCVFEANPWNARRSAIFASFGFLYQGIAQYAIVNLGMEKAFPGNKRRAVISKIFAMNLLSDPMLFMPTFYIFKEAMTQGLGWGTVKAALLGYKANCFVDWRNSWMIWFPGHAVTYGVMLPHQRIPWIACLSFFYMCILSITRGSV